MDEFEVEIVGGLPPRKPDGPLKRLVRRIGNMARRALMRPRLLVLGCLAAFVLLIGTPHAGWDYECRHPMRGPGTCRAVDWCAYYGVQGRRIVSPEYGESCRIITFLSIDWRQIIGG